jgi:hypothetical protein
VNYDSRESENKDYSSMQDYSSPEGDYKNSTAKDPYENDFVSERESSEKRKNTSLPFEQQKNPEDTEKKEKRYYKDRYS